MLINITICRWIVDNYVRDCKLFVGILENVINELKVELCSVSHVIVTESDPERRKVLGAQQDDLQDSNS